MLGVVVAVYREHAGKLAAVRLLKPGIDPLEIGTWGVDAEGIFQNADIDEWFKEKLECVYLPPGVMVRSGVPIEVTFTQATRPVGIPLYNIAGSYVPGDPENRTCEPEEDELLPDAGAVCGEPDWWIVIYEDSPCCDPADPSSPCFEAPP